MREAIDSKVNGLIKQLMITPCWKYDSVKRMKFEHDLLPSNANIIIMKEGVKGTLYIPGR